MLTGFSRYTHELMTRWRDTEKYELAEHASSAISYDPHGRDCNIPWLFYPNAVAKTDPSYKSYNSHYSNQFGAWRFESVCLDFKPDIVVDIRDPWMHISQDSPLRSFFHYVVQPTVDSIPYKKEWVDLFTKSDAVFGYSDWGLEALDRESHGRINKQKALYCGVDLDIFRPVVDKRQHKKEMGLSEDMFIIGTVMRNQKRKLYPDLFRAFRMLLDSLSEKDANKVFLYCHTSYPDVGWNIPELLTEFNIADKVLFSYLCRHTNHQYVSLFQDARAYSEYSRGLSGVLPGVAKGYNDIQLANVYNCFDICVQYSICEGLGMPQIEAAACGVPLASVNYSAMEDMIRLTDGYPINFSTKFRELETNAYRVYPDNEHCVQVLKKFYELGYEAQRKKGEKARKTAEVYFNWDNISKTYEDYFDNAELTGYQGKWNSPERSLPKPPEKAPTGLSHLNFLRWISSELLDEPDILFSPKMLETLRDLNYGVTKNGLEMAPITQDRVFKHYSQEANNRLICEGARVGRHPLKKHEFIDYAYERLGIARN